MAEMAPSEKKFVSGKIAWLAALLAGAALLVTQVETLHDAWCKYFCVFCTLKVESFPVSASSGGSPGPYAKDEQCREHYVPVQMKPTTRYRELDPGSVRFVASASTGRYSDGTVRYRDGTTLDVPQVPKGYDDGIARDKPQFPPEVGWYRTSRDAPREINVLIFTRTGACEALRSISGKFEAAEHVSLWPPNWGQ
jgi:hypothetical protein